MLRRVGATDARMGRARGRGRRSDAMGTGEGWREGCEFFGSGCEECEEGLLVEECGTGCRSKGRCIEHG